MPRESESDSRSVKLVLSGVWCFSLAGLGLFFPFYSLYLRETAGLSGSAVGAVMAAVPAMGLVAQPLWGQLADRTGARTRVFSVIALGTALGYAGLSVPETFLGFLIGTLLLGAFSTALIPSCVGVSLALLRDASARAFGHVRVAGTLGFGISVGLLPYGLAAITGTDPGRDHEIARLRFIFPLAGGCVAIAALLSLLLPSREVASVRAARGEIWLLLRNGPFLRVLGFTFLTYLFTQGAMVLFPILVHAQGGGIQAISRMWLLMLTLEVPLVFAFGAGMTRLGPRGVIWVGTLAATLRWGISGYVDDLRLVFLAQILHGVTVWGIILGVPFYVDRVVPDRLRSTAQGVLAMVGISLGSILSNLIAGWLTETFSPTAPARVAGIACALLALAMPGMIPRLPSGVLNHAARRS